MRQAHARIDALESELANQRRTVTSLQHVEYEVNGYKALISQLQGEISSLNSSLAAARSQVAERDTAVQSSSSASEALQHQVRNS